MNFSKQNRYFCFLFHFIWYNIHMNNERTFTLKDQYNNIKKKNLILIIFLSVILLVIAFFSLFIGSSSLPFSKAFLAIFSIGDEIDIRIIQNIRLPRILTALVIGFALSISGLMMQTCLKNPLSSPSTLGISNATVLGANIAIIALSGGNIADSQLTSFNPFVVSSVAFVFALLAMLLLLGLSRIRNFKASTMVLIGVSLSSLFSAFTTLLQYFASDVELSSAIYWSFGDLSRTSYTEILMIFIITIICFAVYMIFSKQLNCLLLSDDEAKASGVNVSLIRFIMLLLSSLLTAISLSFVGIIAFLGLIAPHIARKAVGNNHSYLIPLSGITGSLLLLISDDIARIIMHGFSLPVGAITSIIGAPFFLFFIFAKRGNENV